MASPAPLPHGGGALLFKPTLHGGEDGESMLPLEYFRVVHLQLHCHLPPFIPSGLTCPLVVCSALDAAWHVFCPLMLCLVGPCPALASGCCPSYERGHLPGTDDYLMCRAPGVCPDSSSQITSDTMSCIRRAPGLRDSDCPSEPSGESGNYDVLL